MVPLLVVGACGVWFWRVLVRVLSVGVSGFCLVVCVWDGRGLSG